MYLYYQRFQTDREHITSTLNGTKTVGYVSLRYTILANNFCPLKWALGFKEHQLNIIVKQAVLENIRGVSELFNSYRMFYKQGTDIGLASEFISERIHNSESVIFFAQNQDGDYLGFTQLYPTFSSVSAKKSWVLNDLFVAENARGFGVAKQLMDAAKALALETNANGIALETSESNHNAQALYESLGYEKSSGVYNYFLSLTLA